MYADCPVGCWIDCAVGGAGAGCRSTESVCWGAACEKADCLAVCWNGGICMIDGVESDCGGDEAIG